MKIGGKDLLVQIENQQPKLGSFLRRYVLPAIQSRGLPGHILATPLDAPGDVQLQPISSLLASSNPKSAPYVGTSPGGSIVAAPPTITGPGTSIDSDFVQFSGTNGMVLKDSGLALTTDGTLAADSDALIPSEKAVKTYVDSVAPSGFSGTIITAALTGGGTQGNMIFVDGVLKTQVQAT